MVLRSLKVTNKEEVPEIFDCLNASVETPPFQYSISL
jgi:hypothetical protein